jgi:hypothetical protein
VNERTENIGARRLHTVMERLLEEASFSAADRGTGARPAASSSTPPTSMRSSGSSRAMRI